MLHSVISSWMVCVMVHGAALILSMQTVNNLQAGVWPTNSDMDGSSWWMEAVMCNLWPHSMTLMHATWHYIKLTTLQHLFTVPFPMTSSDNDCLFCTYDIPISICLSVCLSNILSDNGYPTVYCNQWTSCRIPRSNSQSIITYGTCT